MTLGRATRVSIVVALIVAGAASAAMAADAKALAAAVQIRRTQFGVPHIQADTWEAVAFGFGYCQAEDHLENILRGVLATRGESAQHLGPGADGKNITTDFYNRQF